MPLQPLQFREPVLMKDGQGNYVFSEYWQRTLNALQATINALNTALATKADAEDLGAAHTVPLAKITALGTDGELTFTEQGVLSSYIDPT